MPKVTDSYLQARRDGVMHQKRTPPKRKGGTSPSKKKSKKIPGLPNDFFSTRDIQIKGRFVLDSNLEASRMLAMVEKTESVLVVDRDGAPFIGVSGRQVAAIERGTEVNVFGERGPYTIVCWGSRNGYVPTDHLVSLDAFKLAEEKANVIESPVRSSRSSNPLRLLLPWMRRAA